MRDESCQGGLELEDGIKATAMMDIYKESGEQVRNINQIRASYRGFVLLGLAVFVGLLAGNPGVDKDIWILIGFFGEVGMGLTWVTISNINNALSRQLTALKMAGVSEPDMRALKLEDEEVTGIRWLVRLGWSWRLHLFDYGVYGAIFVASVAFTVWGDPAGLAR